MCDFVFDAERKKDLSIRIMLLLSFCLSLSLGLLHPFPFFVHSPCLQSTAVRGSFNSTNSRATSPSALAFAFVHLPKRFSFHTGPLK